MRLVTVGTGTVVPTADRGSACHWVERGAARVLMDCGASAVQNLARAGLPWGRITHLLITHFHADHIVEIPILLFALRHGLAEPRTEPLDVIGPAGTRDLFDRWAAAYGDWILEPGFPVRVSEIAPGDSRRLAGDLELTAAKTPHTPESLAYRLHGGGRTLGYTGDTGPSDDLAEFFRGADLLLAECSLPDDLVGENHLSPGRLARLAAGAAVPHLAVTHIYPQLHGTDVSGLIREAGYTGAITRVDDGHEFSI